MSFICQAETWTNSFVVALEQDKGSPNLSFSIKRDPRALPGNPPETVDTNSHVGPTFATNKKRHISGSYSLATTLIESISWQLLYVTNLLFAYELILTTRDPPISATPYSWLPAEVLVIVGWLLKSYWNPDSLLLNTTEQQETSQDSPFSSIIMMVVPDPEQGQQQRHSSGSSGHRSSGTSHYHTGSSYSPPPSGSGDGNGGYQQNQHTLGLNCLVCNGICRLRPLSDSRMRAEWTMDSPERSTGNTVFNDLSDVQLQVTSEQPFQEHYIDSLPFVGVASDGVASGSVITGAAYNEIPNREVPAPWNLPSSNDFTGIDGQIDLQNPHEQDEFFINLSHSETQQTTTESFHSNRNQTNVSQTGATQYINDKSISTCNIIVVGEDRQSRPCGEVFHSAKALSLHKNRYHTGEQTCDVNVVEEGGRSQPCGRVFKSAESLLSHKSRFHSGNKTCNVIVVSDGRSRPCGKICKSDQALFDHQREHRKRTHDDVDKNNDFP
ncbi:hypothetical protein [Endozoicomonas sp. 8E]|uniref:hypothetical protein n=1 Tax=Endozoicomonas sp. 8E TaxID=3035692 RepID=UPI002938DBA9|nr:hypothetical protein [Endozoicomonas sp. 8E]WOG27133.1 hypothetical protein P6910_21660 [Endozoicomonas sp. 8E]